MLYEVVLELGWGCSKYYVNANSADEIIKRAKEAGLPLLELIPWKDEGPKSWPHPDDIYEDIETWIAHVLGNQEQ